MHENIRMYEQDLSLNVLEISFYDVGTVVQWNISLLETCKSSTVGDHMYPWLETCKKICVYD